MNALIDYFDRNRHLVKILLIFGVLISAGLFGFVASKTNPLYVLILSLIPIGVVGVGSILFRSEIMPVIILIAAAFVPFSLPTGTGSRLVDSLLLSTLFVGLWIVRILTRDKKLTFFRTPVNLPLISFMVIVVLSIVWSNLFRDPLLFVWDSFPFVQAVSALTFIVLPGVYLLVINFVPNEKQIKFLVVLLLIAGAVSAIGNYAGINVPVNSRGLFAMWVISFSLGLVFFDQKLNKLIKIFLFLLAVAWLYWGVFINISWLAGWLPGVGAALLLAFLRSKKWTLAIGAIAIVIVVFYNRQYLVAVIQQEVNESGISRLEAWAQNWQITKQHLLLGTGPAGYAVYYMNYFPTSAMATHSNFIDLISQMGIIGSFFFLWFFAVHIWRGYKLSLKFSNQRNFLEGVVAASFTGSVCCFIMMGFGDWQLPFAYTQTIEGFDYVVYNWIFMALTEVVYRLYVRNGRLQAEAASK